MNGKIARIEDFLADGWDVEDIVSEQGAIEVLLARGPSKTAVVLDKEDAWHILYGDALSTWPASRRLLEAMH
jgi:hypothetical protein